MLWDMRHGERAWACRARECACVYACGWPWGRTSYCCTACEPPAQEQQAGLLITMLGVACCGACGCAWGRRGMHDPAWECGWPWGMPQGCLLLNFS
jgi:hypothetical protein